MSSLRIIEDLQDKVNELTSKNNALWTELNTAYQKTIEDRRLDELLEALSYIGAKTTLPAAILSRIARAAAKGEDWTKFCVKPRNEL